MAGAPEGHPGLRELRFYYRYVGHLGAPRRPAVRKAWAGSAFARHKFRFHRRCVGHQGTPRRAAVRKAWAGSAHMNRILTFYHGFALAPGEAGEYAGWSCSSLPLYIHGCALAPGEAVEYAGWRPGSPLHQVGRLPRGKEAPRNNAPTLFLGLSKSGREIMIGAKP